MAWIPRWIVALLLLTNIHADSHMLHYLHLKKFLTAVAFARALGKRPTILPIPVPIPIPIAQNEVIKIPIGGGGKTMILDGNKGEKVSHILGSRAPSIDFTGSSSYGYSVPGISNLEASDSNVVHLVSGMGASTGSPRIIVLGGQSSEHPSVIRLSNMQLGTGGVFRGANGMNHFGDSSFVFQPPHNLYSDKPRRNFSPKFRRTRNKISPESFTQEKYKKPIPVGEKFTFRPLYDKY